MKRKKYSLEKILVTGYAAEGKSLARQDGKVIFIEGAVPGDVVDVFVSTNKKDYGEGRVTKIHEYSAERTTPFCTHFGTCGGCKWQMLPYDKQLLYKQQEVAQNFRRIGKVAMPEMQPIIGAEATIHYRNKLEFTFSNKKYLTREEIDTLPRKSPAPLPPKGGPRSLLIRRVFQKRKGWNSQVQKTFSNQQSLKPLLWRGLGRLRGLWASTSPASLTRSLK